MLQKCCLVYMQPQAHLSPSRKHARELLQNQVTGSAGDEAADNVHDDLRVFTHKSDKTTLCQLSWCMYASDAQAPRAFASIAMQGIRVCST